ncbi:MAG: autotransporter-associated beta strand repeat-containing protein, partial [Prevotella sp.]|nr:autotransporter-associated beta strand repeat-containing protein [Prevotella sp.]
ITKVGTGLWRLTGNNTYKGTTSVEGGTLIINGTHSGTGAVTVKNEGTTLKGQGSIAGKVTTSAGTIIEAGDTTLYGKTLTFKGAVTLGSGTIVRMSLFKEEGSSLYRQNNLKFTSSLTINSDVNLELDMTNVTSTLDHGKYFTIFASVPTTLNGKFAKIYPEKPAEGFEWDDSDLYTTGKLYIIKEGSSRDDVNPGEEETEPEGETQYGMVAFGNCVLGSYDNSGINNMLTGADNDEARGLKLVCTGNLAKKLESAGTPKVTNFEYKGTTYSGSNGRTAIKMSNGAQETLFLPEGARATKITFVGFCYTYTSATAEEARKEGNGYPRTCYWREVAGTTFTAQQAEADNKILQTWNDERDNPYVVSFDLNNVPDKITFTNAGEQQAVIILVEYHFGGKAGSGVVTGIKNVATPSSQEGIYDINGRRISNTPHGIYIQQGRKYVSKRGE